jgi:Protein of unknown function (DUF3631)
MSSDQTPTPPRMPTVAEAVAAWEQVLADPNSDWNGERIADGFSGGAGKPDKPRKPDKPVSERGDWLVDGDKVLLKIKDHWATYIATVTEADLDLLTVFTAHTHLAVETCTTPRLQIDSPVPGSGKTTVLEHFQRLCYRSVQMATLSSPALLTRMLDKELRTILIDEADRSLDPDKDGIADLLAVINSGYKRGSTRPVLVPAKGGGWEVSEMPTYAPVVIAGNNPNLPDDTRTRIIRVLLLPDFDGRIEESDWELIEEDAEALHDELAASADQVRDQVRTERPGLPDGITGRFREKWAPLKRVATAAGGDWPDRVDAMALHDREQHEMDKEDGLVHEKPAVVLLRHIYETWPDHTPFLPTSDLIDRLVAEHSNVWGEDGPIGKRLTAQRLGRMLATGYKINSGRETNYGPRGYFYASFLGAWRRMRITLPDKPAHPAEPAEPAYRDPVSDAPDESDAGATDGPPYYTCQTGDCTTALFHPDSQRLGYCAGCRKDTV